MVGRLLSYWEGDFLGAMLNFGRVYILYPYLAPFWASVLMKIETDQMLKDPKA